MGASKEAKKNNQMLDTEYNRVGNQYDNYFNDRSNLASNARTRADEVFGRARSGYEDFLNRARGRQSDTSRSLSGYQNFADTGGLNSENINRMRGMGGFDEFAKTGGISDEQRGMIRGQGTASIPGFYNALSAELGRGATLSGANPGYTPQLAAMARDRSRAASDAATNTELGIMDKVNAGRQWGIGGIASSEGNLVDALQRGKMFGVSGLNQLDQQDRSFDLANSGLDLQALSGLRGLRTDVPGEVSMYEQLLQQAMQNGAGNRRGLLQDRMQYNPNKSFIERIAPYLNLAAGAAGSFFGHPASSGGRKPGFGGSMPFDNGGDPRGV